MKKYFGTDGIRGTTNQNPMTAEIALKVGMAVGAKFTNGNHRHRVVIGKDTRLSGYMIEPALTAGFAAVGMDVFLLGPIPTPGVSMLTKSLRADIGIMISASHNPYFDNGIKIFDRDGNKLNDKLELEIEELIDGDLSAYLAKPENLGRVKRLDEGKERYIEFVKNSFPKNLYLSGLKIVIDCANGAAYSIAPALLWELGAEVIAIGNKPDGFNINEDCGSTKPKNLQQEVLNHGADIGIALDGDADRVLIVDEKGEIIDGDKIIALIAEKLHDEGKLKRDVAVITKMSNLALENYLSYIGVSTRRVDVGDRYVLEEIKNGRFNFGGEQSGHIVLTDYSSTGDGLVAALQILQIMIVEQKKASDLNEIFKPYPQILKNIKLKSAKNPLENEDVQKFIAKKEQEINEIGAKNGIHENFGRILVRKSGTENLIRVMVECKDEDLTKKIVDEICSEIEKI
jgi:phosphoglucosamine mutase